MPLPKPTNLQSKRMLLKTCNSLTLKPIKIAKPNSGYSCVLCGEAIEAGEKYKGEEYAKRAHLDCIHRTVIICVQ